MSQLRLVFIALTGLIYLFTFTAVAQDGLNFITPFLAPLAKMTWPAQFHVDFACYLVVSAIWVAWRHGFSRQGLVLGLVGAPFGMIFFAPYLIYQLGKSGGDPEVFLMGIHAPNRTRKT